MQQVAAKWCFSTKSQVDLMNAHSVAAHLCSDWSFLLAKICTEWTNYAGGLAVPFHTFHVWLMSNCSNPFHPSLCLHLHPPLLSDADFIAGVNVLWREQASQIFYTLWPRFISTSSNCSLSLLSRVWVHLQPLTLLLPLIPNLLKLPKIIAPRMASFERWQRLEV